MIPTEPVTFVLSTYLVLFGTISEYAPGVFERVVEVRQAVRTAYSLRSELPEIDGFVAVRDCSAIGEVWRVWNSHTQELEKLLVADCAGPHIRESDGLSAREWMDQKNVVGEVDWETARRLGLGEVRDRKMVLLRPRPN